MTLQVVIDEVKFPVHSKEIFNLEFDIFYTRLLLVCIRSNQRRCRYINSDSMESQLSGDNDRVVTLANLLASYSSEPSAGSETDCATSWDKRCPFGWEVHSSRSKDIPQRGLRVSSVPWG